MSAPRRRVGAAVATVGLTMAALVTSEVHNAAPAAAFTPSPVPPSVVVAQGAVGAAGLFVGFGLGAGAVESGILPWEALQPRPSQPTGGFQAEGAYALSWEHGSIGFSNPRVIDYDDGVGPVGVVDVTASADSAYEFANNPYGNNSNRLGFGGVTFCYGLAGQVPSANPCPTGSTGYTDFLNVVGRGGRVTEKAARDLIYGAREVVVQIGREDPLTGMNEITEGKQFTFDQIVNYTQWWTETTLTCQRPNGSETKRSATGTKWSPWSLHGLGTPAVSCEPGEKIVEISGRVLSSRGDVAHLGGWALSPTVRDIGGTLHDCLASPNGCFMGWVDSDGGPTTSPDDGSTCAWGPHVLPSSDCMQPCPAGLVQQGDGACLSEFEDVYNSWMNRERVVAKSDGVYTFAPAVDFDYEKRRAVHRCLALATANQCKTRPIFLPGSDVLEASQHDRDAIDGHGTQGGRALSPRPVELTWIPEEQRQGRSYYDGAPECDGNTREIHCDEYPYNSTGEGGSGESSLRLVPRAANTGEGSKLAVFYGACRLNGGGAEAKFLVVPFEGGQGSAPSGLNTQAWCGPGMLA
jgi:hypothetical protein